MIVPYYNRSNEYENPGQSFAPKLQGAQIQTSSAMFGGESGRQLEKAGFLLQRAGNQMAHLANDKSNTAVREKATQFQQDFMDWQAGMQTKKGKDGANAAEDYDGWAVQRMKELGRGMSSVQKDRFMGLMDRPFVAQRQWAEGYGKEQEDVHKMSAWTGEMEGGSRVISANIHNPDMVETGLERIKDASFSMGMHKGFDRDASVEFTTENVGSALASALHEQIKTGNTDSASKLIKEHKYFLQGARGEKLQSALTQELQRQEREAQILQKQSRYAVQARMAESESAYARGEDYAKAPSQEEVLSLYEDKEEGHKAWSTLQEKRQIGADMGKLGNMTAKEQDQLLAQRQSLASQSLLADAVEKDREARRNDPALYISRQDQRINEARDRFMNREFTPERVHGYAASLQASLEQRGMSLPSDGSILTEEDAQKITDIVVQDDNPAQALRVVRDTFGTFWPGVQSHMARDGGAESAAEGGDMAPFLPGGWENNEDDADTVRNLVQRMDAQEGEIADAALLRPVLQGRMNPSTMRVVRELRTQVREEAQQRHRENIFVNYRMQGEKEEGYTHEARAAVLENKGEEEGAEDLKIQGDKLQGEALAESAALNSDKAAQNDATLNKTLTPKQQAMQQSVLDALDPVGAHGREKEHGEMQPYKPDFGASREYYELAVRPLEGGWVKNKFGKTLWGRGQHIEHMQLNANNGDNFGMLKPSIWEDGSVGPDKEENLSKYVILPVKYNAKLIDHARDEVEAEWNKEKEEILENHMNGGSWYPGFEPKRYHWYVDNCQDYLKNVITRAAELATTDNPLIIE